ncbi:mitochondrial 54S ribosomal protein bL28m [Aspergillus lucknowensis]|uniref:50S ribosomal protein L24 n=1 Tax=Aspergillus lucknowensis TaxID=176173 RepID=A0ABR4LEJ3_9EURO
MFRSFTLSSAFRSLSLTASKRSFSTTLPTQKIKPLPDHIPPYPYGPNYTYRQSNTGLYGGATIQFGNKISQGRNEGKTRRCWKPNVRRKKLWSNSLEKFLSIKVTRRALRTIRKVGGLDPYLLGRSRARVKELGLFGWNLRWQVMQTEKVQASLRRKRIARGLPRPSSFEEWLQRKDELGAQAVDYTNIRELTKPTYNEKNY